MEKIAYTEEIQNRMLQGMRAMRLINQNCFLPACRQFDLTFQQFAILMELVHSDGLTAGELSDHTCILRTNFASVANKLGKRGLISQSKSSSDRRYNVIRLTAQGQQLTKDIAQWLNERYGNMFEGEPMDTLNDMIKGFEAMEHYALKLENINQELDGETDTFKK